MHAAADTPSKTAARPLRLWPAVALVIVQWIAVFGIGIVAPGTSAQLWGLIGGAGIVTLLLMLWWLLLSRAPWRIRLIGLLLVVVTLVITFTIAHPSARSRIVLTGLPILSLATAGWLVLSRGFDTRRRWLVAAAIVPVACFGWAFVRLDGVDGSQSADYAFRGSTTPEERLVAEARGRTLDASGSAEPVLPLDEEAAWPGFRGRNRDGRVDGLILDTAWDASPPQELWRRAVGPGWGSFVVAGDRLYTQEQRGEQEIVACYAAATGMPVWEHADPVRFWEALGGAGPRATPAYEAGRIFTVGATGVVNCLDAASGQSVWARDLVADTAAQTPVWGFSSSPLVVDDVVVVYGGGPDGQALVAYDVATGDPRWQAPAGLRSYSSPQLFTIAGVPQVLIATDAGATSVDPATGEVLWEFAAPLSGGERIVQPAIAAAGTLLVADLAQGTRSLRVERAGDSWTVAEGWTSRGLKPYFNDFVVHDGSVYGFDGSVFGCIDAASGERRWKKGRYGSGQVLLLADQDLLLVLTEKGGLVLVAADPAGLREIARVSGIEGKTWNHPVIVGDRLYVRNAEEAACFRLKRG